MPGLVIGGCRLVAASALQGSNPPGTPASKLAIPVAPRTEGSDLFANFDMEYAISSFPTGLAHIDIPEVERVR